MTILELAKLVRDSGCEVDISPSGVCNAVYVTARNKDKVAKFIFDTLQGLSDPEKIIDHTINMAIYQVKDIK